MQITMLGEYAIRTVMHLAECDRDSVVHIREIAAKWDIPESFLRKIVPRLTRAGYIGTSRGNHGGIYLTRPASGITPLEILESVEGKISLNKCVLFPEKCPRSGICGMHKLWEQAQLRLKQVLSSRSISDLI
jgi:Rrf2 family protein